MAVLTVGNDEITLNSFIGPNVASNKVSSLGGVYAKYESDFTQWANLHWSTDGFTWSDSNYYDRAYIFYQYYEATGDATYLDRARTISEDYLHNYVEANNYEVATWWSMMKGVAAHYFEYGDEASRVAIIKVADLQYGDQGADYWAANNWANLVDPTITEGREQARVLEDFVLAYQVGGSDPTWYQYSPDGTQIWGTFGGNNDWKAIAGSLVDLLLTKQDASGGRFYKQDMNGNFTVDKPLMDGLMNDSLIEYYEEVNPAPRIIDFIAKNVKYIYDNEFDPATGMIRYVGANTLEGETDDYTADLNGLIVNGFGFVYAHTGDITFKQMGDAVFAGGVNGAYLAGSKQFNQEYETSWKYLSYTHPELLDGATPGLTIGLVSDTGSSATDKITRNPAIKGTGDANTLVTIKEGTTTLGTTMADITGAWSFTPTGLADGTLTLTATETDPAGNTGSASLSFTLDTLGATGVA